ncbi:pilus assembly protein N-terminal domain-containing protein [uncultured Methylobacterium sp.]|jgi:hypothetical protein|uniref:pilus assembly protein N-terminal domain-containing protein n=1 Tax=uncultured Methylobacterium sp. TaxID=157278 RepID=UPI0026205ABC|nr:pilus assembly protein N-terminal domain-containing protein [uncultured Methylobacterium sp.]
MAPPVRPSPARLRLRRALLAACLAGAAGAAAAGDRPGGPVTVSVDSAKVVRLPEGTATVIVGNPIIADVSLQRNGVVVLTGKSFGSTNLIALDGAGTLLAESLISVTAGGAAMVTVQRGLDRETYSCTPACLPAVQLGDAAKYFTEVSGQAGQRNTLATQ